MNWKEFDRFDFWLDRKRYGLWISIFPFWNDLIGMDEGITETSLSEGDKSVWFERTIERFRGREGSVEIPSKEQVPIISSSSEKYSDLDGLIGCCCFSVCERLIIKQL